MMTRRFLLQWGHGDEAVEESATVTSWGAMLSLQWGHGDEAVEEYGVSRVFHAWCSRFNGATAMKPWKRPGGELPLAPETLLQWGHGDEAVEEVPDQLLVLRVEHASMGPRR